MGALPGPSVFGIDTELQDTNHANYVRDIPAARQLGARYDHITLGVGTARGNFGAADYEVKAARRNHLGVVLSFGGIPGACSIRTGNAHACPPRTRRELNTYKAYVRRMLLRYRNVVQYYESWAEPNVSSSWAGGPRPARYAAVLEAQYAVMQSVNRRYHKQLKLLFGSPNGFQANNTRDAIAAIPFASRVLTALRGARPFDGVALHPYRYPAATVGPATPVCDYVGGVSVAPGYNTDNCPAGLWRWLTWPEELTAYDQLFSNRGYGAQPLWLTEFGWPGNPKASDADHPDYSTQDRYLRQAYADLLQLPFVQAAMWFTVRDYQPGLVTGDPEFFYHYGLLNYDFSQKPAASTFSALAAANPGR
jgi:hypothetical protein